MFAARRYTKPIIGCQPFSRCDEDAATSSASTATSGYATAESLQHNNKKRLDRSKYTGMLISVTTMNFSMRCRLPQARAIGTREIVVIGLNTAIKKSNSIFSTSPFGRRARKRLRSGARSKDGRSDAYEGRSFPYMSPRCAWRSRRTRNGACLRGSAARHS